MTEVIHCITISTQTDQFSESKYKHSFLSAKSCANFFDQYHRSKIWQCKSDHDATWHVTWPVMMLNNEKTGENAILTDNPVAF